MPVYLRKFYYRKLLEIKQKEKKDIDNKVSSQNKKPKTPSPRFNPNKFNR